MKALDHLFRVIEPPVPAHGLEKLLAECNRALPTFYLDFLKQTNGAEWCIHDTDGDCLNLWNAEKIIELNEAYSIAKYVPELLVIGSNGGGRAIGFDRSKSNIPDNWPVIRIGFGNLDRTDFVRLANSFREWWELEFRLSPRIGLKP